MKAIIARNNNYVIGMNNSLPWRCSEDLKHFKEKTLNQKLLVGYNTYKNLPPLKNREIVVDLKDDFIFDVDWCIGGKKTYEKYAPYFTELHISLINNNNDGDTFFPDFSLLNENCLIFYYDFESN